MPRRCNDQSIPEDKLSKLKNGELLTDATGKRWRLGKTIGVGGFGEIYLASDTLNRDVKGDTKYVAKIESHQNGPLFVEMNLYIRIAKLSKIEEWKESRGLSSLGMPHYVASGSHMHHNERYRFLILPRFDQDLEKILEDKQRLNIKSVLTIASQIVDVLEYIHSNGYIHSDIKASNILLSNFEKSKQIAPSPSPKRIFLSRRTCNKIRRSRPQNLRPNKAIYYMDDIPEFDHFMENDVQVPVEKTIVQDQVYLLDYGLASKYLMANGEHKPFAVDQRKAHAGTLIFCSCDAHLGVSSRRSDLESLGYNIIYWLTGNLPWLKDVEEPDVVAKQKRRAFDNIELFLGNCFGGASYPEFLLDYFNYLQTIRFQQKPDYARCKKLFEDTIVKEGLKNDKLFNFDKELQWTPIQQKKPTKTTKRNENRNRNNQKVIVHRISRPPLISNIPIKPLLRKAIKTKDLKRLMKWSQILQDPEIIIKQKNKKRSNDEVNNVPTNPVQINMKALNPTYAMWEVYNKMNEKPSSSPTYRSLGDCCTDGSNPEGYTPAMISVLNEMQQRKVIEMEQMAVKEVNVSGVRSSRRCKKRKSKELSCNRTSASKPAKIPKSNGTSKIKKTLATNSQSRSRNLLKRTYCLRG